MSYIRNFPAIVSGLYWIVRYGHVLRYIKEVNQSATMGAEVPAHTCISSLNPSPLGDR